MPDKKHGNGYHEGPKVASLGVVICLTTLIAWGLTSIPMPTAVSVGLTVGAFLILIGIAMRLFPDQPPAELSTTQTV